MTFYQVQGERGYKPVDEYSHTYKTKGRTPSLTAHSEAKYQ